MSPDVQPPAPGDPGIPPPTNKKPRRRLPRALRWLLILLGTGLLSLGLLLLFLSRIGLPEMVKTKVVAQFKEQGWDLNFSRLLLGFNRGLIVEDLSLQRIDPGSGPQIFAPRAQIRFAPDHLKRFQIQIGSVVVKQARIFHPVIRTNQTRRLLRFEGVGLQLHIRPDDAWEITSLNAALLGIQLQLSGTLTNGSALRTWRLPKPSSPTSPAKKRQDRLHQILTYAEQFHPADGTTLAISFQGDALDYNSFGGTIQLNIPTVASPWITATNLVLSAHIPPSSPLQPPTLLNLSADSAQTPFSSAHKIQILIDAQLGFEQMFPTNLHLRAHASNLLSPHLNSDAAHVDVQLHTPHSTNLASFTWPSSARITATLTNAHNPWARLERFQLTGLLSQSPTNSQRMETEIDLLASRFAALNLASHTGSIARTHAVARTLLPPLPELRSLLRNPNWTSFPIPVDAAVTLEQLQSPQLTIEHLALSTQYAFPNLSLQQTARLYDGRVVSQLDLNTTNRLLTFKGNSSLDPKSLTHLLTGKARKWTQRYTWGPPPKVAAEGRLTLPNWPLQDPGWRQTLLPSLSVAGSFEVHDGSYREVPFDSALSSFNLTNMNWNLPNLTLSHNQKIITASYHSDQNTRDFHWDLNSQIDIKIARPLLSPKAQKGFDYLDLPSPPHIQGHIWGRWGDDNRLGADLQINATNLAFRGQTATTFSTRALYTNQFLTLIHPQLSRDQEHGSAPLITADFNNHQVTISNATGNINPYVLTTAIGPKVARAIAPYRFQPPPHITVNGIIDTRKGTHNSDLLFDVDGGFFDWHHTHLEQASGLLHWRGQELIMTRLQGRFKEGSLSGQAHFQFLTNAPGARFAFAATVTNSSLRSFAENIFEKTNHLEGILSGKLTITNALTSDTSSWNGNGNIQLRDGLIWDIPVFGVFSPILNTILPGTGNSRARQGTATFSVSNSVFHSSDMEIHASGMRMQYDGAVGIDGTVNGRMQIEFLRNLPGFGPLISGILWPVTKLFEFKVSGTIGDPNPEPAHLLPKILLLPLTPLKSLK